MSDSSCTSSAADHLIWGGARVRRWGAVALFLLVLIVSAAAQAQAPAPGTSPPAAVSTDELEELIRTLENDKGRADFIQKLKTLIEARRTLDRRDDQAVGDNWLARFSGQLRSAVGGVAALGRDVDIPRFVRWLSERITDPGSRERGLEDLIKIAAILVAGVMAHIIVTAALVRPRRAIEQRAYASLWARALFAILRFAIDFLPLAVGMGVALSTAGLIEPRPVTRLIALAFVNAMVASEALMMLARLILSPHTPTLRVLPLADETAHYLYIWINRVGYVALYGYFMLEAALLMGTPRASYTVLGNVLGMIVALLLIIFILQNRDAVAGALRGRSEDASAWIAVRRPVAAVWHMLAIFYIVALYLVLAIRGNAGTTYIVRGTVITAVVLGLAWALDRAIRSMAERGLKVGDELHMRFPGLQGRLNRYTTAINVLVRALIAIVAGAIILEAWGLEVFAWIASPIGQRVISSLVSIVVIVALALVTWELVSSLVERRLTATSSGRALSTRALTLLPLARTALRLVLIVLVVMVVLAEIGVNITPLLAGAGFFGLAVGFGAQKLVQDVITGWFILMEDTISVGDVVEVEGRSGLVERINIRTLQLRDLAGAVHTIPFSAVTTVKNMTRDFSYYIIEIGVAYREDTDRVIDVLRGIDEEMRKDATFGPLILAPLDVQGVERFDESAVVIRVRTKTRPIQQWNVGREFNRRIKKAFDAEGIDIPFPHRTVYFGIDKAGAAPPAHIAIDAAPEANDAAKPEDAQRKDAAS